MKKKNKSSKPSKKSNKTKPAKPVKPHSGQSGPKIDLLPFEKMNANEKLVYHALSRNKELTLEELAKKCFGSKPAKKANSWARNSLRRLVRSGMVKKADRGTYRVGTKKLQHVKLEEKKPAKSKSKPKSKPKSKLKSKAVKAKSKPASKPAKKKPAKKPAKKKPEAKAKTNGVASQPVAQAAGESA